MENPIHIAFCSDYNYLMPTGIAIMSVCENNKQEKIIFHLVITDDGKDSCGSLCKVRQIIEDYGQQLLVYNLSSDSLKKFVCSGAEHVSTTGFARVFLPELLSRDISKVLYLDGDIVVLKDLRGLYDYTLKEGSPLGATLDTFYYDSVKQNARSKEAKEYFNSGVLLFDLIKWRNEKISDTMRDYALENFDSLKMLDQDVINNVLEHRITSLPIRYNTLISWYENASYVLSLSNKNMANFLEEIQNPVVCHYIGSQKPWNDIYCPKRTEWLLFHSISPWSKEPLCINQSFEQSTFVLDLRRFYWSDPERYVRLISIVNRYFLASLRLKRKQLFLNIVQVPIRVLSGVLDKIYKLKSR